MVPASPTIKANGALLSCSNGAATLTEGGDAALLRALTLLLELASVLAAAVVMVIDPAGGTEAAV